MSINIKIRYSHNYNMAIGYIFIYIKTVCYLIKYICFPIRYNETWKKNGLVIFA